MKGKKKAIRIRLAVALGILFVIAGVVLSGVLDSNHARVRVINHASDDFKSVWMDCYATGDTEGHPDAGVGKNGKIIDFQNTREAIPYGTKIDLNPEFRKGIEFGDSITVKFRVDGVYMSNGPLEIPHRKGQRPVLMLTGSKEDGYELTYTGKSVNWLIG